MKKQRPQNLKRQVEDKIFLHVQDKNLEKNKDPKIWKGKWGIKFLKMNKDPKIQKGRWGIKYFTKIMSMYGIKIQKGKWGIFAHVQDKISEEK